MVKKAFITLSAAMVGFTSIFLGLLFSGVIWRSPGYYKVQNHTQFSVPVMDMETYGKVGYHRRPYIFQIQNESGSVIVLGIDHTKNPSDPQIDTLRQSWEAFNPDVVFVEGRLGFLFDWVQDPVKTYGESGEALRLAKEYDVPVFTWEPDKTSEIAYMLNIFEPKQLAFFYSLRPYFSNFRFGKPTNPDEKMQHYIDTRTDVEGLRGLIKNIAQIDSMWQADFPDQKDWRDTSDEFGWPEGYLADIAGHSNLVRNHHMCSAIIEAVNAGKNVFISMGSSHAFRIKETLRAELLK